VIPLQLLINGLALGAAYALVALGFVLVLNATGAVNFAHGDLVMAGGLLAVALGRHLPVPGLVLLPAVAALMAGFGLLVSALAYLPLRRRPPLAVFISTIALGVMLQNGALLTAGPEPQAAPALFGAGTLELAGLVLPRQSLAILATAALVIAAQQALFGATPLGRRLRATAEDAEMAAACGIPVPPMILLTFALGTALAGIAGLLLGNQFFLTPQEGGPLMLKAYIAVTLGGWGSVPGAVSGAVAIGVFETLVAAWLSQPVALAALYGLVLLVLALRPQGLFGEAARRRA
jgi:branched-chain amino acid transport system permease protein